MILKEEKCNLFEVDEKYYLAHCISEDCEMGAGIAVEFQRRFKLKNKILEQHPMFPCCIMVDNIFNLVTKKKYYGKPTYDTLRHSLICMREYIVKKNIRNLAMPKIGCGLDKLQWNRVKEILQEEFKDIDIEILVCYL